MGQLLNMNTMMQCPHGGMVSVVTSNQRAMAGGAPIVRVDDVYTIAGCPLNVSSAPHPCVRVEWTLPSMTCKVEGSEPLTTDSVGLCKAADEVVQGTVLIVQTQAKVSAR